MRIWSWTRESRRIFHLSSGMQALLNATSLRGMRWSDVRWPFPSFAVTLDEPILNHRGERFDCILVTAPLGEDNQAAPVIRNFYLIPDSLESRIPIAQFERREIAEHLRKGRFEKVGRRLIKAEGTLHGHTFSTFDAIEDRMKDALISEFTEELMRGSFVNEICNCGKPHPEWNNAIHLVVGMCLYLSSLPAGSADQPVWRKAPGKKSDEPHAITRESEVCVVTSAHRLSNDEHALFSRDRQDRPESEMSPHFRRGHFRRPPGKGNDPTAAKTVWVRPTLVNRDALRQGEIVLGSETKL